jgi:hypothetical protein
MAHRAALSDQIAARAYRLGGADILRFLDAARMNIETHQDFASADLPFVIVMSPWSAAAHWPQKSNPGGFSKEQLGQVVPSEVLHFPQNFMPAGFSNSHFGQRIGSPHFL